MVKEIRIRKGFDIPLLGWAEQKKHVISPSETYALKVTDFPDIRRPKVLVEVGDVVKAGTPLLFDKLSPRVLYTAPVSGEIAQVVRGERRSLMAIVMLADSTFIYEPFATYSLEDLSSLPREDIVAQLCKSGVWPRIIQRPYGIVANPANTPRDIYISTFNSQPLAPDYTYTLAGTQHYFKAGVAVLECLTSGRVNIGLAATDTTGHFEEGVEEVRKIHFYRFRGPHPAGNVGVQIYHIQPLAKGECVWTVSPYGVAQIGKLFLEGRYDTSITLALTGSQVESPAYCDAYTGVCVKKIVEQNVQSTHVRCISGNVLTGEHIPHTGYLGYYHDQLTVIPSGDYREFLGWIMPSTKKFSMQRGLGLFSFLFPSRAYEITANTHGEKRAFLQTGLFRNLLPMDIHVDYLLKAILATDYEEMESLGIYELIEEDVALCEFADISKHEVQRLLREGINLLREG